MLEVVPTGIGDGRSPRRPADKEEAAVLQGIGRPLCPIVGARQLIAVGDTLQYLELAVVELTPLPHLSSEAAEPAQRQLSPAGRPERVTVRHGQDTAALVFRLRILLASTWLA